MLRNFNIYFDERRGKERTRIFNNEARNDMNWMNILKWVGIILLGVGIGFVLVYFTVIALMIFFLTGGLFGSLFFFGDPDNK